MKFTGIFLVFMLLMTAANAQQKAVLRGQAYDTLGKQGVSGATITVLDQKDSSLVTFTMTGSNGAFEMKNIPAGDYRLLITHVNYYSISRPFKVADTAKTIEFGALPLSDKSKVLEEVVVRNEAPPVTLINDTVQYNAGSFKVQPNANVEALLKKLPGVKVEKDGTIKAQGEKVSKVLVDGKEFFGNDPKVATKNLPADAVDKVQVYDKQSDQAQLTGFEDGNYEKTINLKLKADKKKGKFGKVNAGAGTDDRLEGKFNVNSFKGARQFSAIGMGNNTNAEGFSFMDMLNFTGELSRMQRGGGGGNISITINNDDAAGMGMTPTKNNGIVTAWGGGLNYNNIIGKNLDFQGNYFYNHYNPQRSTQSSRQYLLPGSSYYYNQNGNNSQRTDNQRFNTTMLFQLDSFNTLKIVPSFSWQDTRSRSHSDYQTLTALQQVSNEGYSDSRNGNQGYTFRNDMIWRKKFRTKGRTFSLSLGTSLNNSNGDGALQSLTRFYSPNGTLLRADTLNQTNTLSSDLKGYNLKAVYTEPLWKRSLLEFSASRSDSKSISNKNTWDYNSGSGKFDQVNALLTNHFENTYGYTNAGLRIRTQKKKLNYALGLNWQSADLQGVIKSGTKDSVISKSFRNWLPNARFQYSFTKFKTLSLTYSSNTNQPSVSQLQPVPDNSDPLNIKAGNPDLKQEFTQSLMGHLALVSPYKMKNLFFFFNASTTQHKIVNDDTVSAVGVRTTRPVNVNGVYNLGGELSYSMPAKWLKGTIEFSSGVNYNQGKQFINHAANQIRNFSAGPSIRFEANPGKKLNLGWSAGLDYTHTAYSLAAAQNTHYLSQEYGATADWEMPKGFYFSTDFNYTINSQRSAGYNLKLPLWNASISKQMLKFNRGELKFAVRDLLNKNTGLTRTSNANYIEDYRVNSLKRFFLLSFTYSLSKTGLSSGGGGGAVMRVISK